MAEGQGEATAQGARPPGLAWLGARPWLATPLVALIATTFATGTAIIRFAFDAGAGTLTVITVRTTVAALGLAVALATFGVRPRLEGRARWAAPLLGTMIAGYSFCMYRGLEHMPVALTVITFYTYPLWTGLFAWASGQLRLGLAGAVAFPLAFGGLVLALDVTGAGFSRAGAAWASAAALGFAVFLMLSARLFAGGDARPRSFVMLASACVTCLLASLVTGDVALPRTGVGLAALLASSFLYMLAISAMLLATAALGPARVAMVMNVEPVASLVLTYLILGERLGSMQLAGAGCVILAIFIFRPRGAPRR